MREILFKAKRLDNGEWVEGYYECDPDLDIHYICGFSYYSSENGLEREFFNDEVNKDTICQYTGLTDKNGNKIWENDVVEAWSDGTMACGKVQQRIDGTWIMYPAWQNKTMWYFIPNEFGETTVEVIGNIFDNPELLKNE